MANNSQWILQQALYDKLINTPALTALLPNGVDDIFDHVPEDKPAPYCLFRITGAQKIGTKIYDALEISCLIETYDRGRSVKNLHAIAAEIKTALDGATFDLTGYSVVDCRFERDSMQIYEGGLFRKTSQIFKIIIEPEGE